MKLRLPLALRSAVLSLLLCAITSARAYDVFIDETTGYLTVRQNHEGETLPYDSVVYKGAINFSDSNHIFNEVKYRTLKKKINSNGDEYLEESVTSMTRGVILGGTSGDITFMGNNAGAISTSRPSEISGCTGVLTFKNNKSGCGGAILSSKDFKIINNKDILFYGNVATNQAPCGGAIYNTGNLQIESNSGNITFEYNRSDRELYGAAIDSYGGPDRLAVVKINNNLGKITFAYNTGSVIHSHGWLELSYNRKDITFNHNVAGCSLYISGTALIEGNSGKLTFEYNGGSAIQNSTTGKTAILNNQDIIFKSNVSSFAGAAINNIANDPSENIFIIKNNGSVSFVDNVAGEQGGAIRNYGANLLISGNVGVTFRGNQAADGGAIFNNDIHGTIILELSGNNVDVVFENNQASARGGAIFNRSILKLTDNGNVVFRGNTAANGGAIYVAQAIYSGYESGLFELTENKGDVIFEGNQASTLGGAIYNTGMLKLANNGNVVFRGNKETETGRLRSLYSECGEVTLSASSGKSITFYDSIYTSKYTTLDLNADASNGSIMFTREAGQTGEIVSEIYGTNTLYGGELVVKQGARLIGGTLNVENQAGATVQLSKGHMDFTGGLALGSGNKLRMDNGRIGSGSVSLDSGSTLQVAGNSTISGNLTMGDDSTLLFDISGSPGFDGSTPLLTVDGDFTQLNGLNVQITAESSLLQNGRYALLRADKYDQSLWTARQIHVVSSSYGFDDLQWVGNTLFLGNSHDVYFYGTSREGSLSWDGLATWSADDTYEAGSATSFMDGDRVHLEREGRLILSGSAEAHSVNVHLENGSDTVVVGLSGEGGLKVTNVVHVEQGNLVINGPTGATNASALKFDRGYTDTHIRFSGSGAGANATLTLNGGQDFSGLTLKWDTPDAGTLSQGTGACWIDCWTIDMDTTKLVVGNYAGSTPTTASKLIQLDPKSVVFTKNGTNHAAYLPDKNLYDFNPYQAWLRNNNLTTEYGSTAPKAFIYQGDVYYGSMQTSNLQALSQDGTWWAPQSGTRVVYDTEKLGWPSSGTAPTLPEDIGKLDKASCALCVAMNMAGFWMDKYAPLMATDTKPVGLAVGGAHTSPYAPTNVLYLPFWKDDTNEAGLAGNVLQWILTGEGLNTRKGGILVPQPNGYAVFPKGWWGIDTGTTVPDNFRAMDGMIYTCKVDEGWLAPDDFTKIMLAAMRDSDTPIALGYSQNFADARTDSLPNHVVTCWGYESTKIEDGGDIRDVITKVWITDSDDSTCRDSPKQVLDVVYSGDGVYLLNPETDHNVIKKVTLVSFMTTPEGMDDMLEQYQSAWTPAYWTGLKGDGLWDADTSVITYDENGQLVKQTRMAETSDGWSKHCYAYGYDKEVWAHTVFTGQEAYAVFADSVNGRTLTAAQKKVHTLGLEAPRLWAEVTGKGYAFLTGGPGEAATISIGCLSLSNGATLEIGEGVTLSASWVELRDKSVLENHGRIEGWVEMSPGATFISGLVQVTREESAGDLGNGFYACSMENGLNQEMLEWGWNPVELSGGGTYTLGTTFDLAGLDTIWKAAFKLYTPDEREAYILGMFGLAETADTTFKFDVRYIHDSLFATATQVCSGPQTILYASSFEISGDAEEALTIGSGMSVNPGGMGDEG